MSWIPCLSRDMLLCNGLGIRRKSTWQVYFVINYLLDDGITKQPLDLTGFTGYASIKTKAGVETVIASPHVVIEQPTRGLIKLYMSDEETGDIPAPGDRYWKTTQYQYDVVLENEDGEAFRVLEGAIEVSPNVTDIITEEVTE